MEWIPHFRMDVDGEIVIVHPNNTTSFYHGEEYLGYDHHFVMINETQGYYLPRLDNQDKFQQFEDQIEEANCEGDYFDIIYSEIPSDHDIEVLDQMIQSKIVGLFVDIDWIEDSPALMDTYVMMRYDKEIPLDGTA